MFADEADVDLERRFELLDREAESLVGEDAGEQRLESHVFVLRGHGGSEIPRVSLAHRFRAAS